MATPEQVRQGIMNEYKHLKTRASKGEINHSCIYGIIKYSCMSGAKHNGVDDYWRDYLPDELKFCT